MADEFQISENIQLIERSDTIVIYNSIFGNALELPKTTMKLLDHFKNPCSVTNEPDPILNLLVKKRLIKVSSFDEKKEQKKIIQKRRHNAISGWYIRNLQLNLTEKCNMACIYCIQQRKSESNDRFATEGSADMSLDVAKHSIDSFANILISNGNNRGHLMFFGGEPMINFDIIRFSLEYIKRKYSKMNISYVTTSNGTLITRSMAKLLSKHNVTVQVSLDGIGEVNDVNRVFKNGKGSFSAVDKGLRILSNEGVDINLGIVISESNIDMVNTDIIDYALSLGVRNIEVNPEEKLHKIINKNEISNKLLELIFYGREKKINVFSLLEMPLLKMLYHRQGFCSAVGSSISVEPSGDIYLCRCLKEKTKCISEVAGNIDNLKDILKSDYYRNMVERIEGNVKGCDSCSVEGLCGGGCSANAEKFAGNVLKKDSTKCEMVTAITNEELKRLGVRRLSKEAKQFAEIHLKMKTPEDEVEKRLAKNRFNFWDKDLIRDYLGHEKEKEYVPIRMVDF